VTPPEDSNRVLVVDDDLHILGAIKGALEDEGLEVDIAQDGLQALAIAQKRRPDLIVLDVTLPVVSSTDVVTRLRELVGGALPLLVITADGHAADKARRLGGYAYLHKPFELERLVDRVWHGLQVR
jgi:DNA-binding response OmpR family regulator